MRKAAIVSRAPRHVARWDVGKKAYDKWIGAGSRLNLGKDEIDFKMYLWD